jgi:hypothetical protein
MQDSEHMHNIFDDDSDTDSASEYTLEQLEGEAERDASGQWQQRRTLVFQVAEEGQPLFSQLVQVDEVRRLLDREGVRTPA